MRYLLALLVMLSASCTRQLKPTRSGVVVASVVGEEFAACEVILDTPWEWFERACGRPLRSAPWRAGGTCHFYLRNTLGLASETAAPYIGVCVANDEYTFPMTVERRQGDLIVLVVGLRELPLFPDERRNPKPRGVNEHPLLGP